MQKRALNFISTPDDLRNATEKYVTEYWRPDDGLVPPLPDPIQDELRLHEPA